MRRAWVTTVLVGSAVLLSAIAAGQGGAPATISVDEIRPGMRGHGLTVFRGTEPERFDVEVIDVLRAFRPGQDLILIRTPHPVLDRAGTVAGMSGSPIYLDGRLAGAYAYGWLFGRDPVAGVTPIANMLAELGRPVRRDAFPGAELLPRTARASGAGAAEAPRVHRAGLPPWDGSGRVRALDALRRHAERRGRPREGLVPVATPLWLAGFDERVAALLGEELSGFGLVALQGGGSGARSGRRGTARYVDGGAIGVQLIRGDVAATAVGTVTHVAGRRLIAFGHPMLDAGELGLPTCTARVLHVLVSEARSFKIAEAAEPLGALVHDRQATIVVDTSIDGVTIPVRLRVLGVAGAPRTEWNVEVASHRLLSPVLLLAATLNALAATASDDAHAVLVARQRVHVSGRPPLELVDHVAAEHGPTDLRALSGLRLFEVVEAAYGNPFEEARVERVEVDLEVSFRRDWKRIVDVSVAEPQVDPGA
ncbi:MAG: SpoIVB peptidase S55 domain-containing protein, partial [Myxococcales bacterium]|nr:SpoIVB peptidase S55 domain-containing protein [Myxococcales bacterium]